MKSDKLLIGIIAGIVLLVVIALVVTLARPEDTYQLQNTPESVTHDYLLALKNDDLDIAYSHLSSTIPGYPATVSIFTRDVQNHEWSFRENRTTSIAINSAMIKGNRATVTVGESSFRGGDIFNSGQSYMTFEVTLEKVAGIWKIVESPYYFAACWSNSGGCK